MEHRNEARVPVHLHRCPMVPTRYTKLKCWNPAEKKCAAERKMQ
jgi:hypothetical protein